MVRSKNVKKVRGIRRFSCGPGSDIIIQEAGTGYPHYFQPNMVSRVDTLLYRLAYRYASCRTAAKEMTASLDGPPVLRRQK